MAEEVNDLGLSSTLSDLPDAADSAEFQHDQSLEFGDLALVAVMSIWAGPFPVVSEAF
ncbi:hypothetical protein KPL78_06790 [Roseomonas sp. HJA6]|uniref:Uncharacterized protein n=1 Tax=Roseomonas alba TaxID=2846776 RepID=A0ABS7A626_9PROT|nr:hypothetical protein [Neoroseomonas alba]MBW6397545.1 hypothetical protein [Neoroseomonas alba]